MILAHISTNMGEFRNIAILLRNVDKIRNKHILGLAKSIFLDSCCYTVCCYTVCFLLRGNIYIKLDYFKLIFIALLGENCH